MDHKKPNIVRCPVHGLSYNRDRSTGCLRCPDPERDRALALDRTRLAHSWRWTDVQRDPVKRALAGLALALAIGFVPAAYSTFGISGGEVRRIRARQAALSEQPGSRAVLDEFDGLEQAVVRVRQRGLRNSALLWVLISGIAGAAYHRLVPEAPAPDERGA